MSFAESPTTCFIINFSALFTMCRGLKVVDCRLEVSELGFQPCNYVHIQTNILGKYMNPSNRFQLWVK